MCFLVSDFIGMGPRKQLAPRRAHQGYMDFPWYDFPELVGPSVLLEWKNKFRWLRTKYIDIPSILYWNWIQYVGLLKHVEQYLTKFFVQDGVRITYTRWR